MKEQDEHEMRTYLSEKAGGVSIEEFAEHILRNYAFEQRRDLGVSSIEQAYTVLRRSFQENESDS